MKRQAAKLIGVAGGLALATLALSGCADLMTKAPVAPAWFQAKAVEVKGEGYPNIHNVPKVRGDNTNVAAWDAEDASLKQSGATIAAQTSDTPPTSDEIRARAADLNARVETPSGGQAASPTAAKPAAPAASTKP